jgi:hypothetical protein
MNLTSAASSGTHGPVPRPGAVLPGRPLPGVPLDAGNGGRHRVKYIRTYIVLTMRPRVPFA